MATQGFRATIPTGTGAASDAIDTGATGGGFIRGLQLPATFDGTAITFQVSNDDSTYLALYDETGTLVSVTVAASRAVGFKQDLIARLSGWRFIKLLSNASETANRSVDVIVK